jgi:hypothetical protein
VFFVFSLHRESPDLDTGRRTPHFRDGSIIGAGMGTEPRGEVESDPRPGVGDAEPDARHHPRHA